LGQRCAMCDFSFYLDCFSSHLQFWISAFMNCICIWDTYIGHRPDSVWYIPWNYTLAVCKPTLLNGFPELQNIL
jgi:hypothetical protein